MKQKITLKNFDVIKAYAKDEFGVMHFGIYYNGNVIHCTPSKTNPFGGNIIADKAQDFFDERAINKVYPSSITAEALEAFVKLHPTAMWELYGLNCESFVRRINKLSGGAYFFRLG